MEIKKLDEVYSYSMPPVQIVALYTEPLPRYMYNRPYHASNACVRVFVKTTTYVPTPTESMMKRQPH